MTTRPTGEGETSTDGASSDVTRALAGGTAQRVGGFRFYFADGRWEWSEQVQRIHGYQPGTVTPTTQLVLSHKHPDDRKQVAATIEDIRLTGKPFSTRHRIVDTEGKEHNVVVVATQLCDEHGLVIGTEGFYIDVTPLTESLQHQVSAEVAKIAENRAVIEQAKGMLMSAYGISDDSAFDLLKWRSQETNVKLRLLAEQITRDFVALVQRKGQTAPLRVDYDNLLLTAHLRATDSVDPDQPEATTA
jgi:hypothetical protein